MHKGELKLSRSRKSLRQLAFTGLLVCACLSPAAARSLLVDLPQQAPVKSKIELELEKKNNPTPNPPVNKGKSRRSSSSEDRVAVPRDYPVSFTSDVIGADIFLDGTMIGKIGADKKLLTRVKRGQHRVTASSKGYNPTSMTISVVSDRMVYTLDLGNPLPAASAAPSPVAKVDPTPEPSPPAPVVSADDVLGRFIDPRETNTLTTDDWKSLISQTEEGLKLEPSQGKLGARLHVARGQLAFLDHNYAESLTEFNKAIVALPQS
ncbi:MAG TPA: PEGA domain-containing protein, partial [Pyrinomonadaceae bacterium]|nr:PEGA domain-containing protein [Pyrinomonadaceae bacterium]